MRVYVLCDMEGSSGIWRPEQVHPDAAQYAEGRDLMIADVNAAVAGAIDGGATEVVVCDAHINGGHFALERMDPRASYETPTGASPMPSLDASFVGLILTGHHAMAGTLNGFLDHTVDPNRWFCFRINGRQVGEIGMEAAYAGHFGVPLLFVSGDEAACHEAEGMFPGIVAVAVKRGLGRNCAHCLAPAVARRKIRVGVAEAVQRVREIQPWRLEPPIEIELTLNRSDMADEAALQPGMVRVDARAVRRTLQYASEILRI